MYFDDGDPFTLQHARIYEGRMVSVRVDNAIQEKSFEGILRPLTRQTSWVGAEIIKNNEVVKLELED
jgi:hypothetical protein